MSPVQYQSSSYAYHASPRSRAITYALTALIGGLILFMLIQLGIVPPILPRIEQPPLTVDLTPGPKPSPQKKKSPEPAKHPTSGGGAPHKTVAVRAPAAAPETPKPPIPWNVIPLSRDEFAQSDIASKPHKADSAPQTQTADEGTGSSHGTSHGATYGPSEDGGGGETLLNAEWYVRPPRAALASYLRDTGVRTGWGEIACKTVPDFRVEDCHELGETPGSGFARAMREASWQFRVRPPRVNGKMMVGAWVRIHYDMLPAGSEGDDGR